MSNTRLDERLLAERRRAVAAEAALAELMRRHEVLELRNRELAGIVDALARRGRLSRTDDDAAAAPAAPPAEEPTEGGTAE